MSDRILVMTYRPGKVKRIVDIDLPRPRTSEIVGSEAFGRYVAADLERPARGSQPRHAGRRGARAARGRRMTRGRPPDHRLSCRRRSALPPSLPFSARWKSSSRPTSSPASSCRRRRRSSAQLRPHLRRRAHRPALLRDARRMPCRRHHDHRIRRHRRRGAASLQAVATGDRNLGRGACRRARGARLSAVHGDLRPQCLDHHHDRFRRRAAAGDPQDAGRPVRYAQGADQCRQELQPDRQPAVLEDHVSRRPADHVCRPAARA